MSKYRTRIAAGRGSYSGPSDPAPAANTRSYGLPERLREVEALIEDFQWARSSPEAPEHATYCVLKFIASELRGRFPGTAGSALRAIESKIERANATKTKLGYDAGSLRALAETLIGRWPTVKQALEKFET